MARDVSEVDLGAYLDKAPTDLQARFAEWLMEQVGYDPSKAKTKQEAFEAGVRLATAMRMLFQASAENQEVLAERRAEREEADASANKRAATPAKKATNAKKATSAKRKAAEEEPETEPVTKPAKRAAKKTASAPVATGKAARRRAPQPVEDGEDEAPF